MVYNNNIKRHWVLTFSWKKCILLHHGQSFVKKCNDIYFMYIYMSCKTRNVFWVHFCLLVLYQTLYIFIYAFSKNSKSAVKHYMGCLRSRFTKNKNHLEISELVWNSKQFIGFYIAFFTETTFQELSQKNILGMVEALLSDFVETGCRSWKFLYILPSFQSLVHFSL